MKRKHKFGKLDKLIQAQYDRKIKKIEENLSDDGSFDPDKIDSEALFRRIQGRIQEQERQKEKIELEKKERLYRIERLTGLILVTLVGIFCVSMTSEANRSYIGDRIRYLLGHEVITRVGGNEEQNNQKNVISEEEKISICQEIQEEIGIPVPIFKYGSGTESSFTYNIIHKGTVAMIQYQYENTPLELYLINKKKAGVSGMAFHGEKIKEVDIMEGLLTIPVQKVQNAEDVEPCFAAQWEYKDGYYQLSGKVGEKEFIQIVENIFY